MKVWVLQSINSEERGDDAISTSIYSIRDLALEAFANEMESWNTGLEGEDENFVNVQAARDELDEEGSTFLFGCVNYILSEYELDSNLCL